MKKYEWRYGVLAAALTALAAVLIFSFSGRLIGGGYIFMCGDLESQYVRFISQFLHTLFGPEDLDYSFYISMGTPSMPIYAMSSLSFFNVFYLLIPDINAASATVVIAKLATAAFTFQWFSRKIIRNRSLASVAFAMAYALSSYTVTYYFNIFFLDGIYMLPVIAGLIVLFVKEKKWKGLTAAYAYLFLTHFYMGYVIGFFSLVLLLVVMALEYQKNIREYIVTMLRFAGLVLLAAMMGAVFLLPTAYMLLSNLAPDADEFSGLWMTVLDFYQNLFIGQMQTTEGIFAEIYTGIPALFLVPLFFLDRGAGRKKKAAAAILFGCLAIWTFWLPGYMFIHCFDAPNTCGYRFAFLYCFLFAALCCEEWKRIKDFNGKKLWVIAVVNIVIYYLGYRWQTGLKEEYQSSSILGWEINILFLVLVCVLLRYAKKDENRLRRAERLLIVVMTAELTVNGFFCITRINYTLDAHKEVYYYWDNVEEEIIESIKEEDDGVYRIKILPMLQENASAYYDFMGLSFFSSAENYRLRETLRMLGYYTSPRVIFDQGGTPVTEMLFAQKYIVEDRNVWEIGTQPPKYHKNETALGLGYMVEEGFRDVSLHPLDALENLNTVIQGMTGENITCMIPYTGDIRLQSEHVTFGMTEEGTYMLQKEDAEGENAELTYRIEHREPYVSYALIAQELSFYDTNAPYVHANGRICYGSASCIMQMEQGEEGMDCIYIKMAEGSSEEMTYHDHYFSYYDPSALQDAYEALKNHQLVIHERQGSHIKGTVDVAEDKTLLFTSIPYEEGWKIYVDGVEAEPVALLNETFLGVELTPGTHEIEMYYQSRLNTVSAWISASACVCYFLFIIFEKRSRRKMNQEKNDINKTID